MGLARAQTNSATLTVVSAASYQPTVAADSLATIFGTNLANSTAVIQQLDASGNLPTQLAGTQVNVNGEPAGLLYVSPSQINCLIPKTTAVGLATVTVLSTGGAVLASGTASVALVAPAIFTSDSSGIGPGAIINAATYGPGPFSVFTPPTSSTSTYLAVYATGVRNATTASPEIPVQAILTDSSGQPWNLTVNYAGPAPGFFGLDQVNVQLPGKLDGAGVVTLVLSVGSSQSNTVSLLIRSSNGPQVVSVAPQTAAPGGLITITGTGFAANGLSAPIPRTTASLNLGDGTVAVAAVLSTTPTQIQLLVPAIPRRPQNVWYSGPAGVCVQVDGQNGCLPGVELAVTPRMQSTVPPGNVLMGAMQQLLENTVAAVQAAGNSRLATSVQADGEAGLASLNTLIAQVNAGTAPPLTITLPDGSTATVSFNTQVLSDVDSLLLANQASLTAVGSVEPEALLKKFRTLTGRGVTGCALPQEGVLEATASLYNSLIQTQKQLVWYFFGALMFECVAAGPGCPAAVVASFPAADEAYTFASRLLFSSQIGIELTNSFLQSLTVASAKTGAASTALGIGESDTFQVLGGFFPKYKGTVFQEVFQEALFEVFGYAMEPFCGSPPFNAACSWFIGEAEDLSYEFLENSPHVPTSPPAPPPGGQQVELSSSSLSAAWSDVSEVALQFACGLPNQVTGEVTTDQAVVFSFAADKANLLLYSEETPAATFNVTVNPILKSLTLSQSAIAGGQPLTGTVTINGPPPISGFPVELSSNSQSVVFPSSSFQIQSPNQSQEFSIDTRAVSAAESVVVTATSGTQNVTQTLTVNPAVSLMPVVMLSANTVDGGQSVQGTVSLSSTSSVDETVALTSSSTVAQVSPSSVVFKAGNNSPAAFTVTTGTVSSSQDIVITATLNDLGVYAYLTVNPIGNDAVSNITLDNSIVTGGDTVFGTVTLAQPPPPAGVVVNLQSSNSAVALPQSSVTVPPQAPQNAARFSVSTYKVTGQTAVVITATAGGSSKSVNLQVNPPNTVQLSNFSVSPNPAFGGNPLQATLTFSDLTPEGGALVTMTSSDPATIPVANINVPAAANTWQFQISTNPVSSAKTVTLTASYGGSTETVIVTVQQLSPVSVVVNPSSVPGGSAATGTVTLSGAMSHAVVVQLSSSNTAVATVPTTVTVSAGAVTSQAFTVTTSQVQTNQTAVITATYAGLSVTTTISILSQQSAVLTFQTVGAGSGTLVGPWGTGCSSTCSGTWPIGSQVNIDAAAVSGIFAGFGGDCANVPFEPTTRSMFAGTILVTVTGNLNCTADFEPIAGASAATISSLACTFDASTSVYNITVSGTASGGAGSSFNVAYGTDVSGGAAWINSCGTWDNGSPFIDPPDLSCYNISNTTPSTTWSAAGGASNGSTNAPLVGVSVLAGPFPQPMPLILASTQIQCQ
jgi:uncharacterized protein (TIGR03437 family)